MKRASFRFYAELNDFLPPGKKQVLFEHSFQGTPSIKDMIEALGVPHTEVDLLLVNGTASSFSYLVQDGDLISVYPVFESLDIAPVVRLRAEPLREPRFVLDTHLRKLARHLRMLGFDALYEADWPDERLAMISVAEGRILLSRDRNLLKRRMITRGYCVRETDPRRQLEEVLSRFDLRRLMAPFSRCLCCNTLLEPVSKEAVVDKLPSGTRERHQEFFRCPGCRRIYWKGSHYEKMQRFIDEARGEG